MEDILISVCHRVWLKYVFMCARVVCMKLVTGIPISNKQIISKTWVRQLFQMSFTRNHYRHYTTVQTAGINMVASQYHSFAGFVTYKDPRLHIGLMYHQLIYRLCVTVWSLFFYCLDNMDILFVNIGLGREIFRRHKWSKWQVRADLRVIFVTSTYVRCWCYLSIV